MIFNSHSKRFQKCMDKRLLIFGISGFVGSYLADEFSRYGYEVVGADLLTSNRLLKSVAFNYCDIMDSVGVESLIESIKPTHIINLAAVSSVSQSWKNPQKTIAINVEGTVNILQAISKHAPTARVLLIGSSEEYAKSNMPLSEESALDSSNLYGLSKVFQGKIANLYREQYGLKIYYVRSFNHTGVGQSDNFVIPNWCKQIANIASTNLSGTVNVGELDIQRDFCDVKDIVRAYRLVIESEYVGTVFNVGSGNSYFLRDILNSIIKLSEADIKITVDNNRLRNNSYDYICCNYTKINELLNWIPTISLNETIKDIYLSYASRINTL